MLAIASFFIWLSLGRISEAERSKIWEAILKSNKGWIFLSMLIGLFSHWIRAVRWNFLLAPLNFKISKIDSFFSIMAGYLTNLGIPRTGEVLRATLIHKKEAIPFQKLFGTIVTERLVDLVMLLSVTGLSVLLNSKLILDFLEEFNINPLKTLIILVVLVIVTYAVFKLLPKIKTKRLSKITQFIQELIESISSIKKMPKKQYFIVYTVLIWLSYIAMFFVAKYALNDTSEITLTTVVVIFVIGSFAMTLSNAGLGAFPFSIASALLVFGVDNTSGEAFGWLLWTSQTLLNIVFGGLGLLYFAFFGKKKVYFNALSSSTN